MSQGFKEQNPLWLHPLGSISAEPSAFNSLIHLRRTHYPSSFVSFLPLLIGQKKIDIFFNNLKREFKKQSKVSELKPKRTADLPIAMEYSPEQSPLRREKPAELDLTSPEPGSVAEKRTKASIGLWRVA